MADVTITLGLDDSAYQQRLATAKTMLTRLQEESRQEAQKRRTEGTQTRSRIQQEEQAFQRASLRGLEQYSTQYERRTQRVQQTRLQATQRASQAIAAGSQQVARAEQRGFQQRIRAQQRFDARVARIQLQATRRQVREAERAAQQIAQVQQQAFRRVGIGAAAGVAGATLFVRQAEEIRQVQVRLQAIIPDQREFADTYDQLYESAQRYGVELVGSVRLYERLRRAGEVFKVSQEDILTVTNAVNQSLIISGASAQEASSALLQFSQAIASGRLGGEELRAIREAAPRLTQAIAEGLNISIGELRDAGARGELTTQRIIDAIVSQSGELSTEVDNIGITLSRGFQRFANAFLNFANTTDEAFNITSGFGQFFTRLAELTDQLSGVESQAEMTEVAAEATTTALQDLENAFGADLVPERALLQTFASSVDDVRIALIDATNAGREAQFLPRDLAPLDDEIIAQLKELGLETKELRAEEQRRADAAPALKRRDEERTRALKEQREAKAANAAATRAQARADREALAAARESARADAALLNANLERVRAQEAANREHHRTTTLLERQITVLEQARAANLSYADTQRLLAQETATANEEFRRQDVQSSILTQETADQQREVERLEGRYQDLTGGLQQARTATDDLHDSLRRIIESFIQGTGSIGDFTNALLRIGSTIVSDAILGSVFGPGGARGGGNVLAQIVGRSGAGGGGIVPGGGLLGNARNLIGGLPSYFAAPPGFSSVLHGPPAPGQLGGFGRLNLGGLGGLGGGLLGGFLGGRAFGQFGSLAGSAAGLGIAGGIGSLLGGGTFSSGAAGAFGLSGAGLSALLGPAAIGIGGAIVGKLIFDAFNQPTRISLEKDSIDDFVEAVTGINSPTRESRVGRYLGPARTGNLGSISNALEAIGVGYALGTSEGGLGTTARFRNISLAGFQRAGLSGAEGQARALQLAGANDFRDLTEQIGALNRALSGGFDRRSDSFTRAEVLENLAENAGETRSTRTEQVRLRNVLAGIIDLNTQFSESVDSTVLASRYLASEIEDVLSSQGRELDQYASIIERVRSGSLHAAEALTEIGGIEFSDLTLSAEELETVLNRVSQQRLAIVGAAGQSIDARLLGSRAEAEALFREQISRDFTQRIIDTNLQQQVDRLFEGIDLTEPLTDNLDVIDILTERVGDLGDEVFRVLDESGLLAELLGDGFEEAADEAERAADAVERLTSLLAEIDRRQGIESTRIGQFERIGALSPRQAATAQRDLALDAARRDVGFTFGDVGPTIENLDRAYESLNQLAEAEIRLYEVRKSAIEEQLQVDIDAERQRSQERLNALAEERSALQAQLQIARSFAQVAATIRSNIDSLITGAGSPLSNFEQSQFFRDRADRAIAQIAFASPEEQARLAAQASQDLNRSVAANPFRVGDARRDAYFRDTLAQQERLAAFAESGASDIDRIERALEANQQATTEENNRLEIAIEMLTETARIQIQGLQDMTVTTLQGIWTQQQALDEQRNALLGQFTAQRPAGQPTPGPAGGDPADSGGDPRQDSPRTGTAPVTNRFDGRSDRDLLRALPFLTPEQQRARLAEVQRRRDVTINVNIDRRGSQTPLAEQRRQDRQTMRVVKEAVGAD